jgi:hypothetical protein
MTFKPLVLLLFPICAHATTVWDSIPSGSFNTSFSTTTLNNEVAVQFSPSDTGYLSSITLALGIASLSSPPNNVEVFLYADSSGAPASSPLYSQTVDAGAYSTGGPCNGCTLLTFNTSASPLLTAGTQYWLGVIDSNPSTNPVVWYYANAGSYTFYNSEYVSGSWQGETYQQSPLAFVVDVAPTPEPGTFAMLGSAFGLLAWRRSRRRNV